MGSALYWMGADVHGPHYGWSMHQVLAMLLVPDIAHGGLAFQHDLSILTLANESSEMEDIFSGEKI